MQRIRRRSEQGEVGRAAERAARVAQLARQRLHGAQNSLIVGALEHALRGLVDERRDGQADRAG
jgi:hypothetical protein